MHGVSAPCRHRHVFVLLAYLLLGLLLTWPLAAHIATHVPGDGIDDPSLAWNLWWAKHALVDRLQNPFAVGWQFWPIGINLAFYTLTLLNGILSIPLQLVLGLIPTYNILLLSSFVLGGFGAFLLCLDVLRQVGQDTRPRPDGRVHRDEGAAGPPYPGVATHFAAFLGGTFYAFASAKLFYASLGQANIASSQWIPFAVLYIVRAVRPRGTWRDAGLSALFMVFQAYAEMTFASFLLIFAGLALPYGYLRQKAMGAHAVGKVSSEAVVGTSAVEARRQVPARWRPAAHVLLIGLLFVLGLAPMLANMLPDLRAEGDFFASGGGFADLFSADLAGYALPTQLHPALGGLIRSVANDSLPRADGSHMPVDKGQQIYVGFTAAALVLFGLRGGRFAARRNLELRVMTGFWAIATLVFLMLTLGPSLRVLGYDLHVPLPFTLVSRLPFFEGNRYPSRYSVMLLVCLAPLLATGFAQCASRVAYRSPHNMPRAVWTLFAALLAALLFEHLSVPLPLSDLRIPPLYQRAAMEPGDFTLLEVPPGWRNGARVAGKQDVVIMQELWSQSAHGKRLLGGNTSRNPEVKFQYFSEDPTLARLIATTNAADVPQHDLLRAALSADAITDDDRRRAQEWAAFVNVRYAMVHRAKMPAQTERTLLALLPLTLVAEEGDLALYRVAQDLPKPRRFAVGADQGRMILAEGWSPPSIRALTDGAMLGVYAQSLDARLLLPLNPAETTVRLLGRALGPGQTIALQVDGKEVGLQRMSQRPNWLSFRIPADPDRPPLSDVRLRFSELFPASTIMSGSKAVGETGIASPVAILARSAGEETGDFAHIYVNGADLSPNKRGYNLVALDSATGHLLEAASFDTHADPNESEALAAWIAGLPENSLVAGAVRDEGSMNLNQEGVAALQSLGVTTDLRGRFRWGHAFVGAKGAPEGTAVEVLDGIRTAQVAIGPALSGPLITAEVVEVSVGE